LIIAIVAGLIVGKWANTIVEYEEETITHDNRAFLEYCEKSHGIIFFGSIGSGKTAILALLAHEMKGDEPRTATFPCNLPWAEKAEFDFSLNPSQWLGVKRTVFIDEMWLIFQGYLVADVRANQRFLIDFLALSRHQGTRTFSTAPRLGSFAINHREVTTANIEVSFLEKTDKGIYSRCKVWGASAWTNVSTGQEFTVFIENEYLDTYDSYWLKNLKYLRARQYYIKKLKKLPKRKQAVMSKSKQNNFLGKQEQMVELKIKE